MGPDLHQMGQLWDFLNIICQYILSAKKKFQIFQSMIHANMLNFKFMNYKRETIVVTNVSVCLCLSSTQMKLKQCSFLMTFSNIEISNIFQFLLKLSNPIEQLFLLPAGFELRTLLLVSDADPLTN